MKKYNNGDNCKLQNDKYIKNTEKALLSTISEDWKLDLDFVQVCMMLNQQSNSWQNYLLLTGVTAFVIARVLETLSRRPFRKKT